MRIVISTFFLPPYWIWTLLFLASINLSEVSAQLGFTVQKRISKDNFTSDDHPAGNLLETGSEIGLDYRIHFSKFRLIFAPSIVFGSYKGTDAGRMGSNFSLPFNYTVKDRFAQLQISIYPFDFKYGQSKKTPSFPNLLARGFFIQVSVGGGSTASEGTPLDGSEQLRRFYQFSGNAAGGLGFDIPLGKRIIITTLTGWRTYFTPVEMVSYFNVPPIIALDIYPIERAEWTFGLRVGYKFGKG